MRQRRSAQWKVRVGRSQIRWRDDAEDFVAGMTFPLRCFAGGLCGRSLCLQGVVFGDCCQGGRMRGGLAGLVWVGDLDDRLDDGGN